MISYGSRGVSETVMFISGCLIMAFSFICYFMLTIYLLLQKDMSEINKLKTQLCHKFEMKDLRVAKKIFDMEILRDHKLEDYI